MTVKELSTILSTIDEDKKVYMEAYSIIDVNGYYYKKVDGEDACILTNLNVQPRNA